MCKSLKNKNLLIVTSEFPPLPGGIGEHAYQLAKQLHRLGYHITVLSDQRVAEGLEEYTFDEALPFRVVRTALRSPRWQMYFQRIQQYRNLVAHTDVVLGSGKFSLWLVGFTQWLYKKPSIGILHGFEVNFHKTALKKSIDRALQSFDRLVAVSNFTASKVSQFQDKVRVIPNGYAKDKWANTHLIPVTLKGDPKLITVGNVHERKGQLQVIKLLPELLRVFPGLHYHCVGLPTEVSRFQKEAERLGVESYVSFHGRLSTNEVASYLNDADIFVMLSQETATGDVEGFGIAILEANGFGIPALGGLGSGVEDAIQNGVSGKLVDSEDPHAIIEAIQEILRHYKAYSEGAKAWAETHAWEQVVKGYVEVIEGISKQ